MGRAGRHLRDRSADDGAVAESLLDAAAVRARHARARHRHRTRLRGRAGGDARRASDRRSTSPDGMLAAGTAAPTRARFPLGRRRGAAVRGRELRRRRRRVRPQPPAGPRARHAPKSPRARAPQGRSRSRSGTAAANRMNGVFADARRTSASSAPPSSARPGPQPLLRRRRSSRALLDSGPASGSSQVETLTLRLEVAGRRHALGRVHGLSVRMRATIDGQSAASAAPHPRGLRARDRGPSPRARRSRCRSSPTMGGSGDGRRS